MSDNLRATYLTPLNPGMAVLNAMSEIRAKEATTGSFVSDNEQAQTILYHLRDFFGGRVLVLQLRNLLSLQVLIELLCSDAHDRQEVIDIAEGHPSGPEVSR